MRLLEIKGLGDLRLTEDLQDNIPPYAILSHTWGDDKDEVTFEDFQNDSFRNKAGYAKIQFCEAQARKDGLNYFWVDTCCINQAKINEYSEAITSMFRWYRNAYKCYVYLSDVSANHTQDNRTKRTWELEFQKSRWFTRGWTLQELLAPASVEFFSKEGDLLGSKKILERQIFDITGIPISALQGTLLREFSVEERMRWAENRKTKKPEDKAYCLLGIFNVFMPLIYGEGENAFVRLKEEIHKNSRATLQDIDVHVRDHYLRDGCLTIERLSGKTLPMERCFINLCIVNHVRDGDKEKVHNADDDRHRSEFSLAARLKVKTPPSSKQVTLQALFSSRKRQDGKTARPTRILIWGRAGVGKTTLCKKIVHDFMRNGLWSDLFDRVYWLPLRRLKLMSNVPTNVGQLIQIELLPDASEPQHVAEELQKSLIRHGNRSLFILDGLDEVSYALDPDTPIGRLLHQLLKQANIIVTSRPHSTYVLDRTTPDLELETIGFLPAQVGEYLEQEIKQTDRSEQTISEIRFFIRSHPLVQDLVRIPVQLDAMCYAWSAKRFPKDNVTMTLLYQAITQQLWEKDIIRLEKKVGGKRITLRQIQGNRNSKAFVRSEINFLEELAFTCLYNEIVEFDMEHICQVATGQEPILGDHAVHLSFLRSSDSSLSPADRTYHFIHLTFQEFFAAQYFVQKWTTGATIPLRKMDLQSLYSAKNTEQTTPVDFLRQEKYSTRYDIFWRFVTGLLRNEDLRHLHRFFDAVEDEPRDLLGPTHQRLIIHCLSEIGNPRDSFQSRVQELEDNYWSWIQFESKFNSSTALMREVECPDRIFTPWLGGSDTEKTKVMSALRDRPSISSEMLKKIMSGMENSIDDKILRAVFQVLGKHYGQITGENIVDFISKQDTNMRVVAVEGLGYNSVLGPSALEALVRLLQDEDLDVKLRVASALYKQATLTDSTIKPLTRLLEDQDPRLRLSAAMALSGQAILPDSAVEALVRLLQEDVDSIVREFAAMALSEQAILPDLAVEALIRLLQEDKDSRVRSSTAMALSEQANLPDSAVKVLVRLLQEDKDPSVRSSTAIALSRQAILPDSAVETLIRLLQEDKDSSVQASAATALSRQIILPDSAVKALIRLLLEDKNSRVRSSAAIALSRQITLPDSAAEALIRLLQEDKDSSVRSSTAVALSEQANLPDSAVKALIRLLQEDKDSSVRASAAIALSRQAILPDSAVEALMRLLQEDKDSRVRSSTAVALSEQANLPDSTVKGLVRLLQREDLSQDHSRWQTTSDSVVKALENHPNLRLLIPHLHHSDLQFVLTCWLRRSFSSSIACYKWNGTLSINIDGKRRMIPLERGTHGVFESALITALEAIGSPRHHIRKWGNAAEEKIAHRQGRRKRWKLSCSSD